MRAESAPLLSRSIISRIGGKLGPDELERYDMLRFAVASFVDHARLAASRLAENVVTLCKGCQGCQWRGAWSGISQSRKNGLDARQGRGIWNIAQQNRLL